MQASKIDIEGYTRDAKNACKFDQRLRFLSSEEKLAIDELGSVSQFEIAMEQGDTQFVILEEGKLDSLVVGCHILFPCGRIQDDIWTTNTFDKYNFAVFQVTFVSRYVILLQKHSYLHEYDQSRGDSLFPPDKEELQVVLDFTPKTILKPIFLPNLDKKYIKSDPLMAIVGFNFYYDFLFDEPLTVEVAKELLNLNVLVSSLLLSAAVSIPLSIEYEELFEADDRFLNGEYKGYYSRGELEEESVSETLAWCFLWCVVCLGSSIFTSMLLYQVYLQASFDDNVKSLFFWKYLKWSFLVIHILTILGIILFFFALKFVLMVKFPCRFCIGEKEDECSRVSTRYPWMTEHILTTIFFGGVAILFGFLLPSVAMRKYAKNN